MGEPELNDPHPEKRAEQRAVGVAFDAEHPAPLLLRVRTADPDQPAVLRLPDDAAVELLACGVREGSGVTEPERITFCAYCGHRTRHIYACAQHQDLVDLDPLWQPQRGKGGDTYSDGNNQPAWLNTRELLQQSR